MKTCFKCSVEKPMDDFYQHPAMADGRLNKCKECTKRDVRAHRAVNDSVREYDRKRSSQPQRVALRARVCKAWRETHRDRALAHTRAQRAMRRGEISSVNCCESCGLGGRLEKHHHDYSKPLDVVWLCKRCHAKADAQRRRSEAF